MLVCFAGLCVIAFGFVARFLLETRGLSVEEITGLFDETAEHGGQGAKARPEAA